MVLAGRITRMPFEEERSTARDGHPRSRAALYIAALLAAALAVGCQSDEEKIAGFKERGDAYVEDGKYEEAIIEYRNVLQIDPNDVDAHRGLSQLYLQLGSVSDAYWELSETVRLDPDDRDSRNTYAAISLANGRYEVVLEQADALVAQDPNDPIGRVLQAQASIAGDGVEAAQLPELYATFGWVYLYLWYSPCCVPHANNLSSTRFVENAIDDSIRFQWYFS